MLSIYACIWDWRISELTKTKKEKKKEMISEIPKLCGLALAYLTIISIMVGYMMILCTVYIWSHIDDHNKCAWPIGEVLSL